MSKAQMAEPTTGEIYAEVKVEYGKESTIATFQHSRYHIRAIGGQIPVLEVIEVGGDETRNQFPLQVVSRITTTPSKLA